MKPRSCVLTVLAYLAYLGVVTVATWILIDYATGRR